jgi:hypothetical protein
MSNLFKYEKINDQRYNLIFENNVKIGEFILNDDGYFVFFFDKCDGYFEPYILQEIVNFLNKLNKTWDEIVKTNLMRLMDEEG